MHALDLFDATLDLVALSDDEDGVRRLESWGCKSNDERWAKPDGVSTRRALEIDLATAGVDISEEALDIVLDRTVAPLLLALEKALYKADRANDAVEALEDDAAEQRYIVERYGDTLARIIDTATEASKASVLEDDDVAVSTLGNALSDAASYAEDVLNEIKRRS